MRILKYRVVKEMNGNTPEYFVEWKAPFLPWMTLSGMDDDVAMFTTQEDAIKCMHQQKTGTLSTKEIIVTSDQYNYKT